MEQARGHFPSGTKTFGGLTSRPTLHLSMAAGQVKGADQDAVAAASQAAVDHHAAAPEARALADAASHRAQGRVVVHLVMDSRGPRVLGAALVAPPSAPDPARDAARVACLSCRSQGLQDEVVTAVVS
jgi:hypothetical protein